MSIYVAFIGGFQSTQPNMDLWKASAQKQRSDVTFDAYPYPYIPGAGDTAAVQGFEKKFEGAAKKIEDLGADVQIFIVGHSSGCAIANELNKRVKVDHTRITLVDLDGFAPSGDQIKKSTVKPWCAQGSGGKGHSVHFSKSKDVYTASKATQPWSLHFSMVNTAATDDITKDNYASTGYAGCLANLCFLLTAPPSQKP